MKSPASHSNLFKDQLSIFSIILSSQASRIIQFSFSNQPAVMFLRISNDHQASIGLLIWPPFSLLFLLPYHQSHLSICFKSPSTLNSNRIALNPQLQPRTFTHFSNPRILNPFLKSNLSSSISSPPKSNANTTQFMIPGRHFSSYSTYEKVPNQPSSSKKANGLGRHPPSQSQCL